MDYAAISQASKRYEDEAKINKKIFSIGGIILYKEVESKHKLDRRDNIQSFTLPTKEDLDFFVDKKIVNSNNAFLIKGAGVDIEYFKPVSERPSPIVVVLIARMLKDKGIREFVEAARILTNKGLNASFCFSNRNFPLTPGL